MTQNSPNPFFRCGTPVMTAWWYLLAAGVCEVVWALALKQVSSQEQSRWWLLLVVVMIATSITLLGLAMKELPAAIAYAVWVAFGAVGTAIMAWWIFQEHLGARQLGCLALIVLGVMGLHQREQTSSSPAESQHPPLGASAGSSNHHLEENP